MRKGTLSLRAKRLRKDSTDVERLLWWQLRAHRLAGWKFRRQQPIGPYIVDFVCFEKQIIIELDGGQHSQRMKYDSMRSAWLAGQGFRVLRFWNHEVLQDPQTVVEVIAKECEQSSADPDIAGCKK